MMEMDPEKEKKETITAGKRPEFPVCVYIDNSNIFIGAREAARARGEDPEDLRIDFESFISLITDGTQHFDEMCWVASGDPERDTVFTGFSEKGIEILLIPPAPGGENETVDHAIQLSMYRHARKYREHPGLIILCTGDGKGYADEKGFLYDVEGFIEDGWRLSLYSWDDICHGRLKAFAEQHGRYVALDEYFSMITFVKGGRQAEALQIQAGIE